MPKVSSTTKTYKDVINAAKSKNVTINTAKYGVSLDLGNSVHAEILSPLNAEYEDLNDYSAVIKLSYGKVSFLFTGDAGKIPESEMLKKGIDLSASVLKVGHHGSNTSTTDNFLDAVYPKYAVISVGKDNDYNHPASTTISKLKDKGIKIYRTDESGTVIASTDGNEIQFNK
jgi:beta-lactamase superfamily II metal-dependent hydrolase